LPQSGALAATAGSLYAEQRWGSVFGDLSGVIGYDRGSVERQILLPGVSRKATASFNGAAGGVAVSFGDRILTGGGWLIEPTGGVEVTRIEHDGFTESGAGGADLAVAPIRATFVQSQLGARLARSYAVSGGSLGLDASASWSHAFQTLTPTAAESFAGVAGTDFAMTGANPGRDAAVVKAGLTYTKAHVSVFARYDGSFSNRETQNAITGGVRIAW
jgi:outer membrane autotransporter protein